MAERSTGGGAISDMLVESGLFNTLEPGEVHLATRYFLATKVKAGDVVFNEGDSGHYMCVINVGNVSVRKANSDGKIVEIATLRKGRAFGEMAVLDGERRSATCVAASDCVLLTLSKDALDKMVVDTPRVAAKVMRAVAVSLSKRLRMADGRLVDHQI